MKIRIVSSKNEIESLSKSEKIIHLTFRPSNKDIFALVQKCPDVKAIHIPSSYIRTVSDSTKMFLEMQGISLLEGDVWGHRKDINEYYEIQKDVFDSIEELKSKGLPEADILKKMEKIYGLSTDLLKFIMNKK